MGDAALLTGATPGSYEAGLVRILKGPDVEERYLLVLSRPGTVRNAVLPGIERKVSGETAARSARDGRSAPDADPPVEQATLDDPSADARAERTAAHAALSAARAEAESLQSQAASKAGQIVSDAQARAAAALEEARARAAELEAEARQTGFAAGKEDGLAAGRAEAYAELRQKLDLVASVAEQARLERVKILEEAEPAVVELALDIARLVVAQKFETDRAAVVRLAARGLQKVTAGAQAKVRVNPDDYSALLDQWAELQQRYVEHGVQVAPDPAVSPGGCIVETRSGTIDGQLDTQFRQIERALMALTGE